MSPPETNTESEKNINAVKCSSFTSTKEGTFMLPMFFIIVGWPGARQEYQGWSNQCQ